MTLKGSPAGNNSRFAKAGVSCFYESEVLNSNFVHLMKLCAENPRPNAKPENVCDLKSESQETAL
jgi:hypothetical protein